MISCHGWAGGTRFFSKGRLIEPFLGGPLFCGCGAQVVDMDTLSLCLGAWYQTLVRHTSFFEFRPRSGRLQAIGCTRWLLDGCFTTKARTCTRRSSLHSSFFGNTASSYVCCIAQLLSVLVICVSRVTCDFVSRLGGWDTKFVQRAAD